MTFDLHRHVTGSRTVTLEVTGQIDITQVATFRAALRTVADDVPTELTVDLTGVDRLDVAAVTALASSAAAARGQGTEMRLNLPRDPVARRTLDYCGLPDLLRP